MKKGNQDGFSAIEAIIVVLVIVILAGAGYFIWHKDHTKKVSTTNATTSASAKAPAKSYPTAPVGTMCSYLTGQPLECVTANHTIYQLAKVPTSAKYVAWSGISTSLQNKVTADWKKTNCDEVSSAPAKQYATIDVSDGSAITFDNSGNYAELGYGCDGAGADYLYVKSGGTWQQVEVTQDGWACDIISKYHIPNSFLAGPAPDNYVPTCSVANVDAVKVL